MDAVDRPNRKKYSSPVQVDTATVACQILLDVPHPDLVKRLA